MASFIGLIVIASMALFWAVNVLYFGEPVLSVKHIGLGFIFCQACCSVLSSMLPIFEIFFKLPFVVVGLLGLVFNAATIAYGIRFKSDIVMFMCRVEKVKSFNQYITMVKMPKALIEGYIFMKKSENWCVKVKAS